MADDAIDFERLRAPFPADGIEWRVGRAGKSNKGVWAKVLAYMTSRAVQDRLDEVVGPENWQVDYRDHGGALSCGIGIRIGGEWVWKWDGSGHLAANDGLSESDAAKGDFSNAMKRAAVQWGIGRYLYQLDEDFADIKPNGSNYGRLPKKAGGDSFRWDPPTLPAWALPDGASDKRPPRKQGAPTEEPTQNHATPEPTENGRAPERKGGEPTCPRCNGPVWDDRTGKKNPKAPDWKCKDKEGCGWVLWLDRAHRDLKEALEQLAVRGAIKEGTVAHTMEAVQDGDLESLRLAEKYVADKQEELQAGAGV